MNRSLGRAWNAVILVGMLALGTRAFGATSSSMLLRVSDNNPAYSETVTLTAFTQPNGGLPFLGGQHDMPPTGTVSFYEDNGILLQTVNMNHGVAQWSQKFMGGQHTVYAVFNGNSVFPSSTSATLPIKVTAALAVPTNGAYLGAATYGGQIDSIEEAPPTGVGRQFSINIQYYSDSWTKLENELVNGSPQWDQYLADDIKNGRVPLISWGCDTDAADQTSEGTDADIAAGAQPELSVIQNTAKLLAQYPGPVLLRWKWEFNGFWSGHGPCDGLPMAGHPGGNLWTAQAETNFIGAWREIWTIFQQEGATNVVFVWNPNHYTDPADTKYPGAVGTPGNPGYLPGFYPGNTFVDWIGIDTYQGSNPIYPNGTFAEDLSPFYTDYTAVNDQGNPIYGKPLIVGENGAPQYPKKSPVEVQWPYIQGSDGVLQTFDSGNYPALKAECWFALDDSTLDSNNGQGGGGLDAMAVLGANPYFSRTSLIASSETSSWGNQGRNFTVPFSSGPSGFTDWSQPSNHNFQVALPVALTNNGLLPVMNAQIDAITDIAVVRGRGSVTAPVGPFPFSTLTAGQTGTATLNFNWPPSAMCVQMTVHYSGNQGAFKGQNTITVSPFPMGQSCQNNIGR